MNNLNTPTSGQDETIAGLFHQWVERRANEVVFRQKVLGIWEESTWADLGQAVCHVAMGLMHLGFELGETAAVLSNTRREWAFADLGILTAGGVSTGVYPTDSSEQVEYLLQDCGAVHVFVENDEQLDKVLSVRDRLPGLRRIVVFDTEHLSEFADPMVMEWEQFIRLGRDAAAQRPDDWTRRSQQTHASDTAIVVYTSGTTGRPKGAMLTHRNVLFAMDAIASKVLKQHAGDERMGYLPLCHVAERIGGLMASLLSGTVVNFVENPDAVAENIREIQPTMIFGVPRTWEKFYSAIQIRLSEATPFQRRAYGWAIRLGARMAAHRLSHSSAPLWLRIAHGVMSRAVLRNIRLAIGLQRCRVLCSAAAPISVRLLEWYSALGIEVIELYGQTECSGILTANPLGAARLGTVGTVIPGCEIRLSEHGEILARGPNVFAGYLNQAEATQAALSNGWLHTGDVGELDADGYLRIKDRLKDIIITAGGKNITPSEIENELKFSPYISDAVVIGDRRPYLVCLVMIDHENIEKYAQAQGIAFSDYASLCRTPEIHALIQSVITEVNGRFARVEQIKKFKLIDRKLGVEDEELTPTMKLKRKLVNQKYLPLIETMYGRGLAEAI